MQGSKDAAPPSPVKTEPPASPKTPPEEHSPAEPAPAPAPSSVKTESPVVAADGVGTTFKGEDGQPPFLQCQKCFEVLKINTKSHVWQPWPARSLVMNARIIIIYFCLINCAAMTVKDLRP